MKRRCISFLIVAVTFLTAGSVLVAQSRRTERSGTDIQIADRTEFLRKKVLELRSTLEAELGVLRTRMKAEIVGKDFFPKHASEDIDLGAGGNVCTSPQTFVQTCEKCDRMKPDEFDKWFDAVMAKYNLAKSYQDEDLRNWQAPKTGESTEHALHSEVYALAVWQVWLVWSVHVAEVLGLNRIPTQLGGMDDARGPGDYGGLLEVARVESERALFPAMMRIAQNACERENLFHQMVRAPVSAKAGLERQLKDADRLYEQAYHGCREQEESQRDKIAGTFRDSRNRLIETRDRLRQLVKTWHESLIASKMFVGETGDPRYLDLDFAAYQDPLFIPLQTNWLGYGNRGWAFDWPPIKASPIPGGNEGVLAGDDCERGYRPLTGFSEHSSEPSTIKYADLEKTPYFFVLDLTAPAGNVTAAAKVRSGTAIGASENEKP